MKNGQNFVDGLAALLLDAGRVEAGESRAERDNQRAEPLPAGQCRRALAIGDSSFSNLRRSSAVAWPM